MRLPKFDYFEPKEIKEAVSFLQNTPAARILAGGTDLLVNMKHQVERPTAVVNLKGIAGLDAIQPDNGGVRIGALTTLKRIYSDPLISKSMSSVAQAASSVGSYHHQVMGTAAGNVCQQNRCRFFNQSKQWRSSRPICYKAGGEICHVLNQQAVCHSAYCGDVAPALLVFDARVVLTGPGGPREVPLEELFSGEGKTPLRLGPGEILTEIVIPEDSGEGLSGYVKFANRQSIDFPILGMAYRLSPKDRAYRIAFTAVDRKPVRARQVEAFLNGKDLNEEVLEEASGLVAKEAKPVRTSLYSPAYKRRMMGVLLTSAVLQAVRRSEW